LLGSHHKGFGIRRRSYGFWGENTRGSLNGEVVVEVAFGGWMLRDSVVIVQGELMVMVQRWRRLRSVMEGAHLVVDLLAVKILVAVAGGANHVLQSAVLASRHELAANKRIVPICCVFVSCHKLTLSVAVSSVS